MSKPTSAEEYYSEIQAAWPVVDALLRQDADAFTPAFMEVDTEAAAIAVCTALSAVVAAIYGSHGRCTDDECPFRPDRLGAAIRPVWNATASAMANVLEMEAGA